MYKYRNTKTGAEILTSCECQGEDWERVLPEAPAKEPAPDAPAPAKKKASKSGK